MTVDGDLDATRTATPNASGSDARDADVGPATVIGRFSVLAAIGSGGMGLVYSAYDPQLDRRVALKLLHSRGDPLERQRLVREAQALARLAHPNVVAVHDVGSHGSHLFVAMEFVEGTTLREWMDTQAPGDAGRYLRALEILRDAGRGIEAAHAAGLVHRDVKPRNILVGNDGRVRVVDFGLARGEIEPDGDEQMRVTATQSIHSSGDSPSRSAALVDVALTQTGKIVGTPAYMAPEQFQAGAIDHRADQFSFCVTAWEVLFGTRPFAGNAVSILSAIHGGAIERPAAIELPSALEQALRRGLGYRAARRHADMRALLAVLDDELATARGVPRPRASKRGWFVAAGAVAMAGIIAWRASDDALACAGAEDRLVGVWDEERKTAIRDAMLGTAASFAGGAWSRLDNNADGWRTAWIEGHRDACEASVVRNEQSAALMDLRMACLASRRQEMVAYLDLLATPTLDAIANADEGFTALAAVERCADTEYVHHRGERPEDPADAAREDELLAEVSRVAALHAAGDYAGAIELAETTVAGAIAAGSERAHAAALLTLGSSLASVQRPDEALARLTDSYRLGRLNGLDHIAADAARGAAQVAVGPLYRLDDAAWWTTIAQTEASHSGDETRIARAELVRSRLLARQGRIEEAHALVDASIDALANNSGLVAEALWQLGVIEGEMGHFETALRHLAEAEARQSLLVGADHPSLAAFHRAEADALLLMGDVDAAHAAATRSLRITEQAFGPDHVATAPALDGLANILWAKGDASGTLKALTRARSADRPTPCPPVMRTRLIAREAETRLALGETEPAVELFRESLQATIDSFGSTHPLASVGRAELALALAVAGETGEATNLLEQALVYDETQFGSQHVELARIHDLASVVFERVGQLARAAEHSALALDASRSSGAPTTRTVVAQSNLCAILRRVGRAADAVQHCKDALATAASFEGMAATTVATLHNNMGAALADAGSLDGARTHYEAAMDLVAGDGDGVLASRLLANLAEIDLLAGRSTESRRGYSQSVEMRERISGATSRDLIVPLRGLADACQRAGDSLAAAASARRALAIDGADPVDPRSLAMSRFTLARALSSRRRARREAIGLATQAAADLDKLGDDAREEASAVRAWLDDRRAPP